MMAENWMLPYSKDDPMDQNGVCTYYPLQGDASDLYYGNTSNGMAVCDFSRDISKEIFQEPPGNHSGEPSEDTKYSPSSAVANGSYTNLSSMSPVVNNSDANVISIKQEFEESGYDDFARELIKEEIIADIQKIEYEYSYHCPSVQESYLEDYRGLSHDGSQMSDANSDTTEENSKGLYDHDGLHEYESTEWTHKPRKYNTKKKKKGKVKVKSKPCSVSLHKIQVNDEGEWSRLQADCVQCTEQHVTKPEGNHVGDTQPRDDTEQCLLLLGYETCTCKVCLSKSPLERPFKCSECGKAFWKKYGLKKHLIVHSDERPFKCDLCPKEFRRLDSLHLHRRTHTKERIACDKCGKSFSRAESLKKHRCSLVPRDRPVKRVRCSLCSAEFSQMTDLRKHMRAHTKDGSFVCSVCGKSYSRLYHLQQHEGRHTGLLPKCVICGKCFLKEDSLKQHVQLHSAVIEKKCEECGKDLHSLNSIRYHKIMHSGKKQYKCDVCGKEFYMLGHMRFHKKMHQSENKYTCGDCGKNFFWLRSFQAHQMTHVKNPCSCRSCYKVFNDEKQLQRHLLRKCH